MVHNRVYQKMLGDAGWVQESLVSATIAAAARETADLGHAFNFQRYGTSRCRRRRARSSTARSTLTSASATVTGLNTDFTTAGTGGVPYRFYLVFGNDPTKTQYKVTAVASDTSLTLNNVIPTTLVASGTVTTTARLITLVSGTCRHGRRFDHRHQLQFHGGQHRPVAAIRDWHQRRDLGQLLPDHGDSRARPAPWPRRSRPSTLGRCT